MSLINVILSGGVGSRLWPLSRASCPKQYIPLFDNKTLLQLCALRNRPLCQQLIVVGNQNNQELSHNNLTTVGVHEYTEIIETVPRNTAAAIAFAAWGVAPDDILLVTPSDHIVRHEASYQKAVGKAVTLAQKGFLITFGISPSCPETGYGYIEHRGNNVLSFREKPKKKEAETMIANGHFLWNSGMFCFQAGLFLNELEKYAPKVFEKAAFAWQNRKGNKLPQKQSQEIPAISVDYAVMEHSDLIKVVPAGDLGWSDLGSFDALWTYLEQQGEKDQADNNLILGTNKPVFFLGEKKMVYVETQDAILILQRNKSQEVKQLYEKLAKEQPELTK